MAIYGLVSYVLTSYSCTHFQYFEFNLDMHELNVRDYLFGTRIAI